MNDIVKRFELEDGRVVIARANSCLFCEHCTDIWYDLGGIYGLTCDIDGDCESGSNGECKQFKEEVDDG